MKEHQKHAKLAHPASGRFHRHEWAILGTSCQNISEMVQKITNHFPDHHMGYLDASHRTGDQPLDEQHALQSRGLQLVVTDHIHYREWQDQQPLNDFDWKFKMGDLDALWINGNHFSGDRQIIILDPAKAHSLIKRKDKITQIDLILRMEQDQSIPAFLTEHPAFNPAIPVIDWADEGSWLHFMQQMVLQTIPEVKGMVLIGGKSTRMGRDKAEIFYHGRPQKEFVFDLIASEVDDVFYSVHEEQDIDGPVIRDAFRGLGPFGAILSFFQLHPDDALLVAACDLPGINQEAIQYLMQHRNPARFATAFLNPATGFADPLFTIYEPKMYARMLQFLSQGYSCPRKALINSDIELLEVPEPRWLLNVNTPEEYATFNT